MHKSATKCNETICKWCKNKHGASKIIDTFETYHLPLKFTKFMDGRELREAVLHEHSGGGTPYEVEVWYDGAGEQFFKGGWSRFAEDHDLHQGFL
jgi:hypothetical protein